MHSATFATAFTKLAGIVGTAAVIALGAATAAPPVRPVQQLDTQRYSGIWYELARLPNGLQARCVADVTATYRLMDDGSMTVVQRCREEGEHWAVAVGHATPLAGDRSRARMRLSFMPSWLRWLPSVHDDHWVVMVDDDYRYAVVSEPSRQHLWILSRTPAVDSDTYDSIVARLRSLKYPVERLVPTPQRAHRSTPAVAERPPLIV